MAAIQCKAIRNLKMEPFTGQIMLTALAFAPYGWAFCDGSTLLISQYEALFALIGPNYGGDGISNFQLPDLRGAIPLGANSSAPTGPLYFIGQTGGSAINIPIANGTMANSGSRALTYPAANVPQSNLPPFVGLSYIICLNGIFPQRPD
jgi:microcystin-dependent protein